MKKTQESQDRRLSPSDWPNIFADWKESRMTQSEYCKAKTISLHTFSYWRSKLGRVKKSAAFQSVKIKPASPLITTPIGAPIHLRLPSGATVIISPEADKALLKSLLDLLGITSC